MRNIRVIAQSWRRRARARCVRTAGARDRRRIWYLGKIMVKEEGGVYWVPHPHAEGCAHLRRAWILKRNQRPMAPTFVGAPVPRGRPGEAGRSAR
eukprot:7999136-Pyramimonas_sp.AAC.1